MDPPLVPTLLPSSSTEAWPLFRTWLLENQQPNYAHLCAEFGHLIVPVLDCASGSCEDQLLSELLAEWEAGEGQGKYAKDLHLAMELQKQGKSVEGEMYTVWREGRDDWLNSYYLNSASATNESKRSDFRFVYLGGGSTFTPLHRDVYKSHSLSAQILGAKRWFLFPPELAEELQILLKAAERAGEQGVNVGAWSETELARWTAKGMQTMEQRQGETIFVPSGWYHSVSNLDHPTWSVNHNLLSSSILHSVYRALEEGLREVREEMKDVKELLGEGEEWEKCVREVNGMNAGWGWCEFWGMCAHALRVVRGMDEDDGQHRKTMWEEAEEADRPTEKVVLERVRRVYDDFIASGEHAMERRWTAGLEAILREVRELLEGQETTKAG